jgi:hypothetical protein
VGETEVRVQALLARLDQGRGGGPLQEMLMTQQFPGHVRSAVGNLA